MRRLDLNARPLLAALVVAFGTMGAVACGDEATPVAPPVDDTPPGSGPGSNPVILTDPPFASTIAPIFEARGCTTSSCHSTLPFQADLELVPDRAYDRLVNVTAVMEPQEVRVIPGDAENSYLVKKIEGRHTIGNRMPPGGRQPLTQVEIQNIRNWIDQGAKRN